MKARFIGHQEQGRWPKNYFPYTSLMGCLLYFNTHTRAIISFSNGVLSIFVASPSAVHWNATKCVLLSLLETISFGTIIGSIVVTDWTHPVQASMLSRYSDSDWVGNTGSSLALIQRCWTSVLSVDVRLSIFAWLHWVRCLNTLHFSNVFRRCTIIASS